MRVYQFRHQREGGRHCSHGPLRGPADKVGRVRDLCASAVDAALAAGASYADARAVSRRSQAVATKNGSVEEKPKQTFIAAQTSRPRAMNQRGLA